MNPNFTHNNVYSDSSFCRFGAEVLVRLLQTLEAQIGGVEKSEEIEYVHKMRVTSRRIRATLPLFKECFPKKSYKKWLNEIKKVTQFLGAVRDLDVQIDFIKNYIKLLPLNEPKTGMDALLEWYINQRTYLQSNVINGLQELEKSRVLKEIKNYCEQITKETTANLFNLFSVREKAFWQISAKLDEFLVMEEYVHYENENLKHHEMRIRAKWLRYTMECFAPLHPEEFLRRIEMTKNFQDTLGEMHDCDVWIDRIPKFMDELESKNTMFSEKQQSIAEEKQSLLKFLAFITEKRKNQYEIFVSYWDTEKSKNSFEELRKNSSAGFVAAGYRTQSELANPYAKIGVIADINSNLDALKAVIKDAESRGITIFLNAGDTLGFGAYPNEVIQALYAKNALSLTGNFDLEVLEGKKIRKGPQKFALDFAGKTLRKSFETYLRTLPSKLELEIDHKKLVMICRAPDFIEEEAKKNSEEKFKELAQDLKADIIVLGNLSEQFTKKTGGVLFINPGKVGRSGNGKPQASYAAITVNPFSVELCKVDYEVEAATDALRRIGAPESYAQSLLRGLFLEKIIAEDKAKKNDMERNCALMAKNSREVASKYLPDMKHSEHVRKISLEFFDDLKDLHKLGDRERCWLECAAILHDIGLFQGFKTHHKNTLKMILNERQLSFTSSERRAIANIARYHRKGLPINKQHNYFSLSRELKRKVVILSSILRLADGLDFSHQSIIQNIEANVNFNTVTIRCSVFLSPILEEQGFNKKKDLFEKVFAKKMLLEWKHQPNLVEDSLQSTKKDEKAELDIT